MITGADLDMLEDQRLLACWIANDFARMAPKPRTSPGFCLSMPTAASYPRDWSGVDDVPHSGRPILGVAMGVTGTAAARDPAVCLDPR